MRPIHLALITIITMALGGGAGATPDARVDVEQAIDQRLFPDGRVVDIGTVAAGRVVIRKVRIGNRGHTPLKVVSVRVS